DLPPAIKDTYDEFFAPGRGWFQAFLAWDPESLRVNVSLPLSQPTTINLLYSDETMPSLASQVKTVILEITD
ncbi:hypothetical protein BD779DRAFT_1428668, partial [Infundibulicybe gibba]